MKSRQAIIHNSDSPRYDYRAVWMDLTRQTTSIVDPHKLCTAVARMVSETLEVHSINIWLLRDVDQRFTLAGSTVFNSRDAKELEHLDSTASLIQVLHDADSIIDLSGRCWAWPEEVMRLKPESFVNSKMRYMVPLKSSNLLFGMMTLNDDRGRDDPFGSEECELLEAFAAHLSSSLLNLRLSDPLRHANELEVFQAASAFFVHDLKNLASRLSLTMRNLPLHFDKPEFRADALQTISHTVNDIDDMCTRLSMLRRTLELQLVETDLNIMITSSLDELQVALKTEVQMDLQPVPKALIDREQVRKVFVNLIMNASEAVGANGKIRIATTHDTDAVILAVSDNGCGIPEDFLENSLFRPFQTTKKSGLGIGLFHSKLIVDAHKGRIEVKTSLGAGTEFRVVLPAA